MPGVSRDPCARGESVPVNAVIAVLSEDGSVSVSPPEQHKEEAPQSKVEAPQPAVSTPPAEEAKEAKRPTVEQPIVEPVSRQPAAASEVEQPIAEAVSRQPAATAERKVRELRESRTRRESLAPAPREEACLPRL